MKYLTFLSVILSGVLSVQGHSWVDNVKVVGGPGPIDGSLGYIRDFQGHLDAVSSYRMENIDMPISKPNQIEPKQNEKFPRLKAYPGSFVQAQWLENGHTTNPGDTDNPGYDAGPVYIYGTTEYDSATTLKDIRGWQPGSSNRGLLATVPFDDGLCAEPGSEAKPRGAPRWANGGGGPCKGQFQIPEDVKPGTMYTVYWVWDFSKKVGNLNPNHFEWYSSVLDIDIISPPPAFPEDDTPDTPPSAPGDDDQLDDDDDVDDDGDDEKKRIDRGDGKDDVVDGDDQFDDNDLIDDALEQDDLSDDILGQDDLIDDGLEQDDIDGHSDDKLVKNAPNSVPTPTLPLVKRSAKFKAAW
ncbi:hypothetical protein BDZ91DRAFT_796632 [Kalaharituber pfeilii]|nr:hypothetical protein BDZ91DRAFT_796632 [Kalaharituber pfeilii]